MISSTWRKSANNVSAVVITLCLEEGSLEVDVVKGKMVVGTELAGQTEARTTGCRAVCLLFMLLPVLKSLQNPSSLALVKCAVLLPLDRQDPTSLNEILWSDLPQIDQIKDIVLQPGLVFQTLCFWKDRLSVALTSFLDRSGLLARKDSSRADSLRILCREP